MNRFRRATLLTLLFPALTAVACATENTDVDEVVTFTSDDGGLQVTMSATTAAAAGDVTIETVPLPPELKRDRGTAYELSPDGATFDEPITIQRRIDVAERGLDLTTGIPMLVMMSRASDGTWTGLDDAETRLEDEGATLVVEAATTHFSTIVAVDSGVRVEFDPEEVDELVGASWPAGFEVVSGGQTKVSLVSGAGTASGVVGIIRNSISEGGLAVTFECAAEGTGTYGAALTLSELLPNGYEQDPFVMLGPDAAALTFAVLVEAPARCRAKGEPDEGPLTGAYFEVAHESRNGFPSFGILGLCTQADVVAPAENVELQSPQINDGDPVVAEFRDGVARLRGGLRQFEPIEFERVTITTADGPRNVTADLLEILGDVEVTSREGLVAGARCS